jgi:hypothetical protein
MYASWHPNAKEHAVRTESFAKVTLLIMHLLRLQHQRRALYTLIPRGTMFRRSTLFLTFILIGRTM